MDGLVPAPGPGLRGIMTEDAGERRSLGFYAGLCRQGGLYGFYLFIIIILHVFHGTALITQCMFKFIYGAHSGCFTEIDNKTRIHQKEHGVKKWEG